MSDTTGATPSAVSLNSSGNGIPRGVGSGNRNSVLLSRGRDAPGDISPVFARQGLSTFVVPKAIQDERIRVVRDFQFHALLGRGGFGSVFLATETP